VTVIGIDDTDSRETGMCTTYVAARLAARIREEATVSRLLLVRLNPAVEFKTRGNAALAVHTDLAPERAFHLAREAVAEAAQVGDANTNPGLVVAPGDPDAVPPDVAAFSRDAVQELLSRERARERCAAAGYAFEGWKNGRGLVGALAAVGAWAARNGPDGDWTTEVISYRIPARWGTPRAVVSESVFAAADAHYPAVWDTVDRGTGETVCVPHTPGPVLHGIRGDDPAACRAVADAIDAEPVDFRETFLTNQGTDDHLREGTVSTARDAGAYRLSGVVVDAPETRRGGHVFLRLAVARSAPDGGDTLSCAAFEPTKRFRDRVRALRAGDRITACGEVSAGTLKLEKFRVRELNRVERVTPTCPGCDRTMKSAGRGQGYRCRDCDTHADGKVERSVERALEVGWYEVPPRARRHVARPLIRGGFDGPTHPES
jgi:tRNA(Ile2)-agmatinylcytidine synthase